MSDQLQEQQIQERISLLIEQSNLIEDHLHALQTRWQLPQTPFMYTGPIFGVPSSRDMVHVVATLSMMQEQLISTRLLIEDLHSTSTSEQS